jgi:hypothetical protein
MANPGPWAQQREEREYEKTPCTSRRRGAPAAALRLGGAVIGAPAAAADMTAEQIIAASG